MAERDWHLQTGNDQTISQENPVNKTNVEGDGQMNETPRATGIKVRTDSPIVKGVPRRSQGVYGVDSEIFEQ